VWASRMARLQGRVDIRLAGGIGLDWQGEDFGRVDSKVHDRRVAVARAACAAAE
jgi:hypothetical protein